MYELDTFQVTHASKYPSPVLSLGLSPNCGLLAVGMANGMLSVRRHARPKTSMAVGGGGLALMQRRQRWVPPLLVCSWLLCLVPGSLFGHCWVSGRRWFGCGVCLEGVARTWGVLGPHMVMSAF